MARISRGEGQGKFAVTAAGTNAGVTAKQSAVDAKTINIPTHVSVSGDAAALVTIESPASTVIWQKRYAAAFADEIKFEFGELEGVISPDADVLVKISASTSHCEANIAGVLGPTNA